MSDFFDLSHMEGELVPEILPADTQISISGEVAEFSKAISAAVELLPSKEVIPMTTNVEVRADDTFGSMVTVSATDGFRTFERAVSSLTVHSSGTVLIPGKRLRDILKLAPDEQFRLDVQTNTASIRSGRALWQVPLVSGKSLPKAPDTADIVMSAYNVSEFSTALSRTLTSAAVFSSRMSLTQLNLSKKDLTSCDGARVHRIAVTSNNPLNTTIPFGFAETLLHELRRSSLETFSLGASSQTIVAQVGGSTLTGQKLTLPYPNVEPLLLTPSMMNTDTLTVSVSELKHAITRVRVSADPDLSAVSLVLRKLKGYWVLFVQATDKSGNASQEMIPSEYSGSTARSDAFNFRHLLGFLDCISDDTVSFKLGESTKASPSPYYAKTDSFEGVIQPMLGKFAS